MNEKDEKPLLVLVSLLLIMVTALAGCGKSAAPAPAPPAANNDGEKKTDPPAEGIVTANGYLVRSRWSFQHILTMRTRTSLNGKARLSVNI